MKQAKFFTEMPVQEPQEPFYISEWETIYQDFEQGHALGFMAYEGDQCFKVEVWVIYGFLTELKHTLFTKTKEEAVELCKTMKALL